MWMIFQCLVVFAVIASNIHYQWTPNAYLASLLGVAAAFALTAIIGSVLLRLRARHDLRIEKRAG